MQPSSLLRVQSVNVGLPREVLWKGRQVLTGIFKEPVAVEALSQDWRDVFLKRLTQFS